MTPTAFAAPGSLPTVIPPGIPTGIASRIPSLVIRPLRPDDADALGGFLQALSATSRRQRFHGAINATSSGLLRLLTQDDGLRRPAWVALAGAMGAERVVGEARFTVLEPGCEAEIAMVVADDCRGLGVADMLMRTLLAAARARGLQRLWAEVLENNARMRRFVARHGFVEPAAQPVDEPDICRLSIELRGSAAPGNVGRRGGIGLRGWLQASSLRPQRPRCSARRLPGSGRETRSVNRAARPWPW